MWTGNTYEEIYRNFRFEIPEYFNIGVDICDKWAKDKYRLALIYLDGDEKEYKFTYWELKNLSNRLANSLTHLGIEREDRVAILMPPTPETLISHIAVYKLGAILVPMIQLFGPLAVEYRLQNSGAKAIITDRRNLHKVLEVKDRLPELKHIVVVDSKEEENVLDFRKTLEQGGRHFTPVLTRPDDPALIIYTSGTTGTPKGASRPPVVDIRGHQYGILSRPVSSGRRSALDPLRLVLYCRIVYRPLSHVALRTFHS